MKLKSRLWVLVFAILVIGTAHTQNRDASGHARPPGKHSTTEGRFRVSRYAIKLLAARPGIPEIAVAVSGGRGYNSVSVWNYETKKMLFALRFRDPVSCINYSAAGNFLIVSRSGGTVLLDPETGEVLKSPELPPSATLVLTGPSERTMVFYLPTGVLSYWNLETENETQRFDVPSDIQNPVLFGNNCFLAGFDSGGLLVLDAVTGLVLAREPEISKGSIFTENAESTRFYCVTDTGLGYEVYLMEISLSGILTTIARREFFLGEANRSEGLPGQKRRNSRPRPSIKLLPDSLHGLDSSGSSRSR